MFLNMPGEYTPNLIYKFITLTTSLCFSFIVLLSANYAKIAAFVFEFPATN